MSRIDLTPFIREDRGSEIVIDLPYRSTERAFFNGYQTWTYCPEYSPEDRIRGLNGLPKFGIGDVEHYAVPTVLNTFRFDGSFRAVTVLCPYEGPEPPVLAVEASGDAGASEFTVVLRGGGRVTVKE